MNEFESIISSPENQILDKLLDTHYAKEMSDVDGRALARDVLKRDSVQPFKPSEAEWEATFRDESDHES